MRKLIRLLQRQAVPPTHLHTPLLNIIALRYDTFRDGLRHRFPHDTLTLQRTSSDEEPAPLIHAARVRGRHHFHRPARSRFRRQFLNILRLRPHLQCRGRNIFMPRMRILASLNPPIFHIKHRRIPARRPFNHRGIIRRKIPRRVPVREPPHPAPTTTPSTRTHHAHLPNPA